MSKEIKEYDERGNLVYHKYYDFEEIKEYDERGNLIYVKYYDKSEYWFKYDKDNRRMPITKQEIEWIEFKKKEKEFLSREKISRFRLMDI